MRNALAATMEASHPHLTTQRVFCVENSRARHSAELVTGDAAALKEHLEQATGKRLSALEGVGAAKPVAKDVTTEAARTGEDALARESGSAPAPVPGKGIQRETNVDPAPSGREKQFEMDLEL